MTHPSSQGKKKKQHPASAGVFLLNPGNARLLRGESKRPVTTWAACGTLVLFAVFSCILVMIISIVGSSSTLPVPTLLVMGAVDIGLLIALLMSVFKVYDNIQLERNGKLLRGELLRISGKWVSSGEDSSSFQITVRYAFTVSGSVDLMEGETKVIRDDLHDAILPERGTPLAIFYLNKTNYRVL